MQFECAWESLQIHKKLYLSHVLAIINTAKFMSLVNYCGLRVIKLRWDQRVTVGSSLPGSPRMPARHPVAPGTQAVPLSPTDVGRTVEGHLPERPSGQQLSCFGHFQWTP